MTREEAIKILTEYFDGGCTDFVWDAYQLAIKALQAQDVDVVSRQAVMWMLTNLSYTQCRTQGEVEVIGLAKTMLIAMPSAQEVNNSNQEVNNSTATQPNGIESQASYRQVTGKLDVTDCISRQTAINAIENTDCELPPNAWDELTDAIMRVPSTHPEYEPVKAEDFARTMSKNTIYGFVAWYGEALRLMERYGFVICKKTM